MHYAMSDIHGEKSRYDEMLQEIGFSEKDELYIIGDVIDRFSGGVDILRDIMPRPNVHRWCSSCGAGRHSPSLPALNFPAPQTRSGWAAITQVRWEQEKEAGFIRRFWGQSRSLKKIAGFRRWGPSQLIGKLLSEDELT